MKKGLEETFARFREMFKGCLLSEEISEEEKAKLVAAVIPLIPELPYDPPEGMSEADAIKAAVEKKLKEFLEDIASGEIRKKPTPENFIAYVKKYSQYIPKLDTRVGRSKYIGGGAISPALYRDLQAAREAERRRREEERKK